MSAVQPPLPAVPAEAVRSLPFLVLVVALLVGGAASVDAVLAQAPTGTRPPAAAFDALTAPQQAADRIGDRRLRSVVRPGTTRLLGTTALGTHYLGVAPTGEACLVTVSATGVPETGCAAVPTDSSVPVLTLGATGDVALVADGFAHGEDWRAAGRNLAVRN